MRALMNLQALELSSARSAIFPALSAITRPVKAPPIDESSGSTQSGSVTVKRVYVGASEIDSLHKQADAARYEHATRNSTSGRERNAFVANVVTV